MKIHSEFMDHFYRIFSLILEAEISFFEVTLLIMFCRLEAFFRTMSENLGI